MTPRDRDAIAKITPPKGVQAQIAKPPVGEFDDTPTTGVTAKAANESPLQAVERRSRETKNGVFTTLDRIAELRTEQREDNQACNNRIDETNEQLALTNQKLDGHGTQLVELKTIVEMGTKQNETIIGMLSDQLKANQEERKQLTTVHITREMTEMDISKTDRLEEIESRREDSKLKRKIYQRFAFKAIAAGSAILAAALAGGFLFKTC